jgi:hypothetical protein
MFDLTWQEFSRRPHIAKLPLSEQTRQFHWEQQRHQMLMEYVSSTASGVGGSSGAGGGNSTVEIETLGVNGVVENGYIGQYFEL